MCGRFANQQKSADAWEDYFGEPMTSEFLEEVVIGYNIAPTQIIPVGTKTGWLAARWGMIGPWVKDVADISSKFATFNARSETVSEKATFKSAWNAGRRCIIPAVGYFEWKGTKSGKQPSFVHSEDGVSLCFGGLYEPSRDSICASCTIITLPASDAMKPLHHRMPLMFSGSGTVPDHSSWLENGSFDGHLDTLSWHAVSKAVNNPKNQGSELINP